MIEFASTWPLPKDYCPPVLGNGTLTLLLDPRCSMEQRDFARGISKPVIIRTGYRYDDRARSLMPFGFFETARPEWGAPVHAQQRFDARQGVVSGVCSYESGITVNYSAFCALYSDFVALKLSCSGTMPTQPRIDYTLSTKRLQVASTQPGVIAYELDGLAPEPKGVIGLFAEGDATFSAKGPVFSLEASTNTAVFYLAFGEQAIATAKSMDFAKHLAMQQQAWAEHFSRGWITTPDKLCNQACDTALYYLRLVSTPHSIPTGLFPSHWQGRYFCFDEYFSMSALLRAGHLDLARRVPEFRLKLLPVAQTRDYNYDLTDGVAHYPWESGEDGAEATSDGFWLDHIFEHANVILSCYDYWKYSNDASCVKRYYPVMRACARYFETRHIYHDSKDGTYIGIVTDLERLGPGKIRPFMTTCGVVCALRAAAEAAEFLQRDAEDASRWRQTATELLRSIPRDDTKYLPYPNAKDTAIGMLAGTYPFPVIAPDDPLQTAAVEDFMRREGEFGCMKKSMGHEICTWYSCWKSIYASRVGNRTMAAEALAYAIGSVGHFGESYESNRRLGWRPWFSTGSGAILQAASESLLQVEGNTLHIGPGTPKEWTSYEFLLAAPNDLRIHCAVKDGRIAELDLLPGPCHENRDYQIVGPDSVVQKAPRATP
ncbi:MAG: hypothetical protein PHT80_08410 [Lentisphaeria bacterium]|nr:hypothetical protein [Lentisphaeria bacterium]